MPRQGTFTDETYISGYGERAVIRFNCQAPIFKNIGLNVFVDLNFQEIEILGDPPLEFSQCDGNFYTWVQAIFSDRFLTVWITPALSESFYNISG